MVWSRDFGIDETELSMLRRVYISVCSVMELEPQSEGGAEVGKMLFHLYQQGVRDELALIRMLTDR